MCLPSPASGLALNLSPPPGPLMLKALWRARAPGGSASSLLGDSSGLGGLDVGLSDPTESHRQEWTRFAAVLGGTDGDEVPPSSRGLRAYETPCVCISPRTYYGGR